jgi:hypothetical protein
MRSKSRCALARRAAMTPRAPASGEHEAAGQDDPRQDRARAADRFLRHDHCELLSRGRELLAHGACAGAACGGTIGGRELQAGGVPRRRAQRRFGQEDDHGPGAEHPVDQIGRRRDQEEPARPVSPRCDRRGTYATGPNRAGQRRGDPGLTPQIDGARVHGREARDQRRRQVGGGRRHRPAPRVGRDDGTADTPLVRRAVSGADLLGPRGGREVGGAEPPRCVAREPRVRDACATFVQHGPAQAPGERRRHVHATADLRRRDLDALLGAVSRITRGEHAGDDETRDGQPENQCHCCDVSRPQERTSGFK